MADSEKLVVIGAAYGDVGTAMKDFAAMQGMYRDGKLQDYDAAIVTKDEGGTLLVSNADSTGRYKSSAKGAIAGAVLGIIFPPSAIALAALGAGAGAVIGQVKRHLTRGDFKELGELLQLGESGILFITDSIDDEAGAALFGDASRSKALLVEGDKEAIKEAVRQAAGG